MTPSYRAVLRTPHAGRTFAAALLGRLSYGMVPLALLLAVRDATGSYPAAGTVLALFGLASVLLAPARAALVDRHGPRRVLPPLAAGYAGLLVLTACVTWRPGTPPPVIGALAVAAGAGTPLGPVMRTLWRRLLPDRELLRRAYSLDTVAEELLFVSGPLLVGLLLAAARPAGLGGPAGPAAALVAGAVLVLAGALALAAAPPVRALAGPAAGPGPGAGAEAGNEAGGEVPGTQSADGGRPERRSVEESCAGRCWPRQPPDWRSVRWT